MSCPSLFPHDGCGTYRLAPDRLEFAHPFHQDTDRLIDKRGQIARQIGSLPRIGKFSVKLR